MAPAKMHGPSHFLVENIIEGFERIKKNTKKIFCRVDNIDGCLYYAELIDYQEEK